MCFQPLSTWDSHLDNVGLCLLFLWYPPEAEAREATRAWRRHSLFLLSSDIFQIAEFLCGMSGPPAQTCCNFPAVLASLEADTDAGISHEFEEMLRICSGPCTGNFKCSHILLHLFFDYLLNFLVFS